jgi:hypothetical protein
MAWKSEQAAPGMQARSEQAEGPEASEELARRSR